jgi:hypothetical protein
MKKLVAFWMWNSVIFIVNKRQSTPEVTERNDMACDKIVAVKVLELVSQWHKLIVLTLIHVC